jgi:sulfite reductase (NADPH) hemoprotein beta-component
MMVPLGLGDDQDPDGPQTAYKAWEPQMWKALGVDVSWRPSTMVPRR